MSAYDDDPRVNPGPGGIWLVDSDERIGSFTWCVIHSGRSWDAYRPVDADESERRWKSGEVDCPPAVEVVTAASGKASADEVIYALIGDPRRCGR